MAIRTILRDTDPILRKTSRPVERFDDRLMILLDDMANTMVKSEGVGLAAPQVGVLRRVITIDVGHGVIEMINPEILSESDDHVIDSEGCLSSPGEYGLVKRPRVVMATYLDRHGNRCEITGEGLLSRAICHEVDHLDGRLFKDLVIRMLDPEEID
ncbi:MAG: peptide deformylase [Oscillospiraceae bacterium]